jgi:hypothetical protein
MKLQELKLTEEVGGKNKKLFDENSDNLVEYMKKQLFDIRKAEKGEHVHITIKGKPRTTKTANEGDYVLRLHDDIEQVDLIDGEDIQGTYEQIQPGAKEDAEGYITYREIGEYEAFKYAGEQTYIYTDWNTKQKLSAGDYLVRDADDPNASGFVVPAAEFDKHFEEVK